MLATAPADAAPDPISDTTAVLTPRGHVAVAIVRLGYRLRDLDRADRAYCVQMLRDLLEDVAATSA